MTIKEQFNVWFFKHQMVKLQIFNEDKRVRTYYRKLSTTSDKLIEIGEATYKVDANLIYFDSKGIPTLTYYVNNPNPCNHLEGVYEGNLSAVDIHTAINETITKKIILYAKGEDNKLQNTLMLFMGIIVLAFGAGIYFLYENISVIIEFINENQDVVDYIKQQTYNGGVN